MLRKSTQETLSLDPEATELLEEIYDMGGKQEQLLDGAIGGDTTVPVPVLKTTTKKKRKKKSASTRQYSEPQAIAAEQRSLPDLALPRSHVIIKNELPTPGNNVALNNLPGSDYPSACASVGLHQQGPLQETHVGSITPSPYSGSDAQVQFPMPISPVQQAPLQALPTAALLHGQDMKQTMGHDGNPIPQGYTSVRSQSVVHEQSSSYNDWGTSGHRQHDFKDDAGAGGYSCGMTSIGYPISGLAYPLLPLNSLEDYGRIVPPEVQLAQAQLDHNVVDDDGYICHAQHRVSMAHDLC
ncbi:MAG: hypothetical protein Q9214_007342 [Letrouitia sp. 1 TL-2023]